MLWSFNSDSSLKQSAGRHVAPHAGRHVAPHAGRHVAPHAGRHVTPHAGRHVAPHGGRHVTPHGHIILNLSQPVIALAPRSKYQFYKSLVWPNHCSNPRSTALEASTY